MMTSAIGTIRSAEIDENFAVCTFAKATRIAVSGDLGQLVMDCSRADSDGASASPPFFSTQESLHTDFSEDEASVTWSAAMNRLSNQEREKVLYEIHGVNEIRIESSKLQQEKLQELSEELSKIVIGTCAYKMALSHNPKYVNDVDFRLKFLRYTEWHAREAATILLHYFQAKRELFGEELLTKSITQAVLSPGVRKCLELGFLQVLPFRDAAGRAIVFLFPSLLEDAGTFTEDMVRAVWYTIYSTSSDIETSIHGLIGIHYLSGVDRSKLDRKGMQQLERFSRCLPYRFRAVHICDTDSESSGLYQALIIKVIDAITRVRLKYHLGSHVEVVYQLQTFGVQGRILPLTKHGELTVEAHKKWLYRQKRREEDIENVQRVLIPTNKDVLSGRGRGVQEHVGNLRFRQLVAEKQQEYDAHKDLFGAKGRVADKIIQEILSQGGRFLKDDGIGWVALKEAEAREKVAMTFRSRRKESNAAGRIYDHTL